MDEKLIEFQQEAIKILLNEPFCWRLSEAIDYASRLAKEYFIDDRIWKAKDAILEDIQYWP